MQVYARMLHVAMYVIYDPFSERLDAYRLDAAHRRYEPIARDERGLMRWFDSKGAVVPLAAERADAESARARALEEEVARLRDELKRR